MINNKYLCDFFKNLTCSGSEEVMIYAAELYAFVVIHYFKSHIEAMDSIINRLNNEVRVKVLLSDR